MSSYIKSILSTYEDHSYVLAKDRCAYITSEQGTHIAVLNVSFNNNKYTVFTKDIEDRVWISILPKIITTNMSPKYKGVYVEKILDQKYTISIRYIYICWS